MVKACKLESYSTKTVTIRRATAGGGIWGICAPRNFQNIAWQF